MTEIVTRRVSMLDNGFILAPERYDPRRQMQVDGESVITIGDLVTVSKELVSQSKTSGEYLVLDTSDVREGMVVFRKELTAEIGSTKKRVHRGNVIISRLRPYLRQAAFVDNEIPVANGIPIVCSTEFYVLQGSERESIAFLVPYLLSDDVQAVLAASQEGGHHPRFDRDTLCNIPVPKDVIQNRRSVSADVERSVRLFRESESLMKSLIETHNGK